MIEFIMVSTYGGSRILKELKSEEGKLRRYQRKKTKAIQKNSGNLYIINVSNVTGRLKEFKFIFRF